MDPAAHDAESVAHLRPWLKRMRKTNCERRSDLWREINASLIPAPDRQSGPRSHAMELVEDAEPLPQHTGVDGRHDPDAIQGHEADGLHLESSTRQRTRCGEEGYAFLRQLGA